MITTLLFLEKESRSQDWGALQALQMLSISEFSTVDPSLLKLASLRNLSQVSLVDAHCTTDSDSAVLDFLTKIGGKRPDVQLCILGQSIDIGDCDTCDCADVSGQ